MSIPVIGADARQRFVDNWTNRTFKREVAVALLGFWAIITAKVFFYSDVAMIGALGTVYGTVSTMVGMFAMAAFGFDAWNKQVNPSDGLAKS